MSKSDAPNAVFAIAVMICGLFLPLLNTFLVFSMWFKPPAQPAAISELVDGLKIEMGPGGAISRSIATEVAQSISKQAKTNGDGIGGGNQQANKDTQDKLDRLSVDMKGEVKLLAFKLNEFMGLMQTLPRATGGSTSSTPGKSSLVTLCLSKSLNMSNEETRDLVSKILIILPPGKDSEKPSAGGKLLMVSDISAGKKMLVGKENVREMETWLAANGPSESRPALDSLPKVVVSSLGDDVKKIERLVVVTNHEFRFREMEMAEWNQFKSVVFVMVEGPIPDYFEWGHFNKLKEFRKKWQGNETKSKIFKRQLDKGMILEEMVDLADVVREVIK